jgi:SAM-dependent methyltransferase
MAIDYNFNILETKNAFRREDESDDKIFYSTDRFVSHIDSRALETIEKIISNLVVEENPAVLDIMSGWDSHMPDGINPTEVVGLGLNENELRENNDLTQYIVHDINKNPRLPLESDRFDVVLNTVSVDYLTRPIEVFREIGRVLRPGGIYIVTFSNRMFRQKAVKIWKDSDEEQRVILVDEMFRSSGLFGDTEVFASIGKPRPADDKYSALGIPSDPVFAVYAEKKGAPAKKRPNLYHIFRSDINWEKIAARKREIKHTYECPYCGEKLSKWDVPENPFYATWENDHLYICFNDRCDYYVRGWDYMFRNGYGLCSYRFMYDHVNDSCHPVPVQSQKALKEGIVEQG